jgi:hypothetical protein
MTWFRHRGDTKFCTGAPVGGSFATLCHGRWPLTDVAHGLVESSENPPTVRTAAAAASARDGLEIDAERAEVIAEFGIRPSRTTRTPRPRRCGLCAKRSLEIATERARRSARETPPAARRARPRAPERAAGRRLRVDLAERTKRAARRERELADADPLGTKYGAALVEAIGIAQSAGRRGCCRRASRTACASSRRWSRSDGRHLQTGRPAAFTADQLERAARAPGLERI